MGLAHEKALSTASGTYDAWVDCLASTIGGPIARAVITHRNTNRSKWRYAASPIDGIPEQRGLGEAIRAEMPAEAPDSGLYYDKVFTAIRDCPNLTSGNGPEATGGQPTYTP